jgi:hypothetical protein
MMTEKRRPAHTAATSPLDLPMTPEERVWWRSQRPRVLAKKFGWMFLTAGGFTTISGFTRPFFTHVGPVDLMEALRGALFGALVAVGLATVVVLWDRGETERKALLRARRLREAMRE